MGPILIGSSGWGSLDSLHVLQNVLMIITRMQNPKIPKKTRMPLGGKERKDTFTPGSLTDL